MFTPNLCARRPPLLQSVNVPREIDWLTNHLTSFIYQLLEIWYLTGFSMADEMNTSHQLGIYYYYWPGTNQFSIWRFQNCNKAAEDFKVLTGYSFAPERLRIG